MKGTRPMAAPRRIDINFVKQNYPVKMSQADLARHFHVSKAAISQMLKRYNLPRGLSCWERAAFKEKRKSNENRNS